jgi:hypothetical protein
MPVWHALNRGMKANLGLEFEPRRWREAASLPAEGSSFSRRLKVKLGFSRHIFVFVSDGACPYRPKPSRFKLETL